MNQPQRVTIGGPNYAVDQPAVQPVAQAAAPARTPHGIVYFATDSAELTADGVATLTQYVSLLKAQPDQSLQIEGHTDGRGSHTYNTALGMRRAISVKRHLIEQGVSAQQLRTLTLGRDRPLAACAADSCLQQNRRVHLFLGRAAAGRA